MVRDDSEIFRKTNEVSSSAYVFDLFDANFFNNEKIPEIVKGVKRFNIPVMRTNRKLVASVNGGLHYPFSLVFNPEWDGEQSQCISKRFNYPSISGTKRPESEEDIAFMSVLELGELIKTKQITSEELAHIFFEEVEKLWSRNN